MTNVQAVELFVFASSTLGFYVSAAMAWTGRKGRVPFYHILSVVFALEASLVGIVLLIGMV